MARRKNKDTLYITPVVSNVKDRKIFKMPIIEDQPGMKDWIQKNRDLYKTKKKSKKKKRLG